MRLLLLGRRGRCSGSGKIRMSRLLLLPILCYVHSLEGEALSVDGPIQVLQGKQVLMGQRRLLELCLGDLRCEVFLGM